MNLAKKAAERKQSSGSSRTIRYRGTVLVLLHQCSKELMSDVLPLLVRRSISSVEFPPVSVFGYGQMTVGQINS